MKLLNRFGLFSIFLFATSSTFATAPDEPIQPDNNQSNLATYLLNLGGYLGYDLQNSPTATTPGGPQQTISQNLLFNNGATAQLKQNYLFGTYLGALLVNTSAASPTQFVPTGAPYNYTSINAFANTTFQSPTPYSTPSQSTVSVSPLIDQPPYQADPVSQAILNILTTPDFSNCLNNDQTAIVACTFPSGVMDTYTVLMNVIGGTLPNTQNFFTYNQVQPLLAQLNVNSLITPLQYSSQAIGAAAGSPVSPGASPVAATAANQGLVAANQEQQAANFIRFASGAVSPMPMPNRKDYDDLYVKATSSTNPVEKAQAQATLTSYLNSVRIFAAQSSVGLANLYYILSKRLPQSQGEGTSGSDQQMSQALSEFAMATWRLYNPDAAGSPQWVTQINNASAATVQKEMAVLLAEINYQLYLSRQQQERLLLTNTMLLIQNARASQPSPTFTPPNTSATLPSGTTGSGAQ